MSIPVGQTKCRFCLTNHLGDESASTDGTASGATLLGVVHMVVESTTFYGAVAKGGAAATLLTANETEPAIDAYTLLYDLDETPAPQLADRWPSLPAAVHVAPAKGEQLLVAGSGDLTAGAATRDITPENGDEFFGYVRPDIRADGVAICLFANALVLNDGDRKFALVAADLGAPQIREDVLEHARPLGFDRDESQEELAIVVRDLADLFYETFVDGLDSSEREEPSDGLTMPDD